MDTNEHQFPENQTTTDYANHTNLRGAYAARVLVSAARRNNLFQQNETNGTKSDPRTTPGQNRHGSIWVWAGSDLGPAARQSGILV
jgi:hypothetical protein